MSQTFLTPDDLVPVQQQAAATQTKVAQLAALQQALEPPPPFGAIWPYAKPAAGASLLNPARLLVKAYSFGSTPGRLAVSELPSEFSPSYPNGDTRLAGNQECQVYATDWSAHSDTPSSMLLTASATRAIQGTSTFNPADIGAIKSGMIATLRTFEYGVFEARLKAPPAGSKGAWGAFWMTVGVAAPGVTWWPPELDMPELVDNSGSAATDDGPGNPFFGVIRGPTPTILTDLTNEWGSYHPGSGFDASADFHWYSLEWTPDPRGDRFRRYLDQTLVHDMIQPWAYGDGTRAAPAHLYVDLAVGGPWAGRNGIQGLPFALEVSDLNIWA